MQNKFMNIKKELLMSLNQLNKKIDEGIDIDEININHLDEFAQILDNYIDLRVALEDAGSATVQ